MSNITSMKASKCQNVRYWLIISPYASSDRQDDQFILIEVPNGPAGRSLQTAEQLPNCVCEVLHKSALKVVS